MTRVLDAPKDIKEEYVFALREFLDGAGERALQRAYEMSRAAMGSGLGVLDLAAVHFEAVDRILADVASPEERLRVSRTARDLFVETLTPFEMTHRAFREANIALRGLNERLEEEARRIAHSLHDDAGQILASIEIELDRIVGDLPSEARTRFNDVKGLLDRIGDQLRHLSHELRPTILDDLGLLPALRFLAEGASARGGIPIEVRGELRRRLGSRIETAIYRVVQEALNNLIKHARATRASVRVEKEDERVRCSVRDDGTGFDVAAAVSGSGQGCLGLLGIRERLHAVGGTLEITSAPGKGTELMVSIPVE